MEVKGTYTGTADINFSVDSETIKKHMTEYDCDIQSAINRLAWNGKLDCSVKEDGIDTAVLNIDTINYRVVGGTKEEIEELWDFIDQW